MIIRVGVVGATGYTGLELLKILAQHPQVELSCITSRAEAGKAIWEVFPMFHGLLDLKYQEPSLELLSQCHLVFFATPNGIAMNQVATLIDEGVKVIDLSADFRLKDPEVWKLWYDLDHACPELLDSAVYGLPEFNRDAIRSADLVANPGCYPTAVQLALAPVLNILDLDAPIIADCKSGVSGAGRGAQVNTLHCEVSESFSAYGVAGHRHVPEIDQQMAELAQRHMEITFVPHLVPMVRGIHATIYGQLAEDLTAEDVQHQLERFYRHEEFVDVLPQGHYPKTANVKGSNRCQLAVVKMPNRNQIVLLAVIDNLIKGAAGQAVQNMNIMYGLEEEQGIPITGTAP